MPAHSRGAASTRGRLAGTFRANLGTAHHGSGEKTRLHRKIVFMVPAHRRDAALLSISMPQNHHTCSAACRMPCNQDMWQGSAQAVSVRYGRSLVVDDVLVGVAALGGAAVVTPVAAVVGDHHLGAVLIVSQVAQLTVLHSDS